MKTEKSPTPQEFFEAADLLQAKAEEMRGDSRGDLQQVRDALEIGIRYAGIWPTARAAVLSINEAITTLDRLIAEHDKQGWQPIETAPMDGTPVDLWMEATNEYDAYRLPNCSYDEKEKKWFEGDLVEIDGEPTHWMPLPQPQTKGGE